MYWRSIKIYIYYYKFI